MKKIDVASVPAETDCNYPYPFNLPCSLQSCQRLARHEDLTHFGVNLTVIQPGGWSSQRNWHSHEDEFFWVVEGELTLVTNSGEEPLRAGGCAAFQIAGATAQFNLPTVPLSLDRESAAVEDAA
jgi:uncharacterized cupin superfamily protein